MKLTVDELIKDKKIYRYLLASKKIIYPTYKINALLAVEVNIVSNEVAFIIEDFENEKTIYEDKISLAVEAYNQISGGENERD